MPGRTQDLLDYLYALRRFGMKLGLEQMERLMGLLGNPERGLRCVHVGGTNGKGSVVAMVSSALQAQGLKVGRYTSPHLFRFNERIAIDSEPIGDETLAALVGEIREACAREGVEPTFFEFTTALAFLHFAREDVDVAVIEVGLGGRLDATNVLLPDVTVITNVALDHMEHLGSTTLEIAGEKAGIVKPGVPLVTGEKDPSILALLRRTCEERGCDLVEAAREARVERMRDGGGDDEDAASAQRVRVSGAWEGELALPLLGDHQRENLGVALCALLALRARGIAVSDEAIQEGIAHARWDARMQVVSRAPLIIVDGAHNEAGMHALRGFVEGLPRRKALVLGLAKDKDARGIAAIIAPLFDHVIVTQGMFKPMDALALADVVRACAPAAQVRAVPSAPQAIDEALALLGPSDAMLVAGSLYLAPLALARLFEKVGPRAAR